MEGVQMACKGIFIAKVGENQSVISTLKCDTHTHAQLSTVMSSISSLLKEVIRLRIVTNFM